MWEKLQLIFKDKDIRKRVLFVFAIFAVFRVTAAIPVPGIDAQALQSFFAGNQLFGLLNIFSGGALDNLSVAMLALGPYITAVIIFQLLTMIFPALKALYYEEGEAGRQKFNQYSRFLTVPLAFLQGFGLITFFKRQGIFPEVSSFEFITSVIVVTAGAIFLMWLGELISQYGIGNGISLLIFAGIVSRFPIGFGQTLAVATADDLPTYALFIVLAIIVIAGVVVVTEGERPIPVYYAKRVRGMRMYGGGSTHLPLRVNQAGVIPIIFALSILLFPQLIANMLLSSGSGFVRAIAGALSAFLNNPWLYALFYFVLVFVFTYFYTAVTFDPKSISENLQKSGAFIPGIRPGPSTTDFLKKLVSRITLMGALFLGAIAVLPLIVRALSGIVTLTIGGIALLIVVAVVIETIKQIEGQLAMRAYE